MYPFLWPEKLNYNVPMYDLMILTGLIFMYIYVSKRLEVSDGYSRKQTNMLMILLTFSLFVALGTSYIFDGIFHSIESGELTFGSITFIGGLIGGVLSFLIGLKYIYKYSSKDIKTIFNTVITGVVLAHAFGRIGCFLAGCCFGIPTDNFLGVIFPHGSAHDMFPGISIYPTQLFEAVFLFILFVLLNKAKYFRRIEFEIYLISYGIWRIIIELIRGDDRGSIFSFVETRYNTFPTPSQYLSLIMLIIGIIILYKDLKHESNNDILDTK